MRLLSAAGRGLPGGRRSDRLARQARRCRRRLTPDEAKLVAFVDANNDAALKTLEQVVNINSGTQNFAGVREVGEIFRRSSTRSGSRPQWVDGAPFKRAGHLVAEHAGPGPKLLLIGHLDTVFEPNSPFQKFERIDARYASGPGIIDMKGGNVIMLQALKALQSVGALKTMNIVVVMTGDEEDAGSRWRSRAAPLVAAAKGAAAAIGFEDGPGKPADRGHRAARHDDMDAAGEGAAGALVADLPRRYRRRRDLRGRAHPERLPREALGRTASDVQSRHDRRRHVASSTTRSRPAAPPSARPT